ncbi:NAD(P)H-dependent oxidoreductase [Vibrio sp. Isolate23]|uniref:FMN-dependent NADH-azoreductase n=1 Tax=Vibrio sp. Isolate23 TaxID=2908533 RepID=UPI001EFEC0EB|nr:NAD(P)H-dependent oxidoreductase [Vibrio sp. Isolate23]MCG9681180.1 NAD(P)H-dependent oxidoreductase [Vibrio sp. Isolate23]
MNILLVNSSPRKLQACTYQSAQLIIQQMSEKVDVEVVEVDTATLPHLDADYAKALSTPGLMYDESSGSLSLSNQLIAQLNKADLIIIASPMHNFTLPSSLKCWVDHVVRAGRTFEITDTGKRGLLIDKPIYVLVSAGGRFSGKNAYQPDFFTPYLTEIMATIGLKDIKFFTIEGTATNRETVQEQIDLLQKQLKDHLESAEISREMFVAT